MKLNEIHGKKQKAGFIPYFKKDNETFYLFMIPSNPMYGGPLPQIAKGHVDAGENSEQAAIREAEEELGLRTVNLIPSTIHKAWVGEIAGMIESYQFTVYVGEVKDQYYFSTPHYETGSTHWLTAEQFSKTGKLRQQRIVKSIDDKLKL